VMACLSVCPYTCLACSTDSVESSDTETGVRELCQNGRTDRDAVSDTNWATAQGTMNCVGAWSPRTPREKKQSCGTSLRLIVKYRECPAYMHTYIHTYIHTNT